MMEHGFVGTNMAAGKHNLMGGNSFVRISMAEMVIIVTYCNHSNPIDINQNISQ